MSDKEETVMFGFYGSSDDLFMMTHQGMDWEEISPNQRYKLTHKDETMVIAAFYDRAGVWCIGVEPLDEDVPLPNWPCRVSLYENGYSTYLEIEAPVLTELEIL